MKKVKPGFASIPEDNLLAFDLVRQRTPETTEEIGKEDVFQSIQKGFFRKKNVTHLKHILSATTRHWK